MKKLTIFAKAGVLFLSLILTVNAQGPNTLYEMVPHVVLPQTIQYRPMPSSFLQPGTYTAYTNYPATYTAFPSYTLPYPTQMQPVQQAVYPVIPSPVAQQPVPETIVFLVIPTQGIPKEVVKTEVGPKPESKPLDTRPTPALPRAIQKKKPYREIDVYTEEEKVEQSSDILPMNFSSSLDSFLSKSRRPVSWGAYSLVQWSYPTNPGPFASVNLPSNPCMVNGYDPSQPPVPTPNTMNTANTTTPFGFAVNSGAFPPYANPFPQTNSADNATTSGLNQNILNQIEQLLQQNPNMQFSAVMMGPNGQLIPLSGGNSVLQQQTGQQTVPQQTANPAQQMQQLQTQMQYIQAMNQYVHQLNAARMNPHCVSYGHYYHPGYAQFGGYAPYLQPIPGTNGAYALANPYYLAMYQSLYGGYSSGYGGYGPMFNPYLPGYYGTMPEQREKGFFERLRERRRRSEQQMCDAWRAPHHPEETGMRMPAKNAYPWGYFGAQVAPQETPNFGGYYGMYFGRSGYPGL